MQTFLPYEDFEQSAKCLDRQRLGKQRVEAWQILNCLLLPGTSRWENHPAVKMWSGFEIDLIEYGIEICREWKSRGYKDNMLPRFEKTWYGRSLITPRPYWLGCELFHISHQSNLVRKLPEHYRKFFPSVPDNLPYIWPVK